LARCDRRRSATAPPSSTPRAWLRGARLWAPHCARHEGPDDEGVVPGGGVPLDQSGLLLSSVHPVLSSSRPEDRPYRPATQTVEAEEQPDLLHGLHLLPLEPIAARFSTDPRLPRPGRRFGGEPRQYGDAAVELLPFPRTRWFSSSGWRTRSSQREATCCSTRSARSSYPPTSCGRGHDVRALYCLQK